MHIYEKNKPKCLFPNLFLLFFIICIRQPPHPQKAPQQHQLRPPRTWARAGSTKGGKFCHVRICPVAHMHACKHALAPASVFVYLYVYLCIFVYLYVYLCICVYLYVYLHQGYLLICMEVIEQCTYFSTSLQQIYLYKLLHRF